YTLGMTATSIFGTKGAGTVTKAGTTTAKTSATAAKTGVANASKKVSELDMSNLFPYAPQYQVATGGNVPFNVVDGKHLKNQLILKAERLDAKGTGNMINSDIIKKYIRDIEGRTGRVLPKNQTEKLKEALRNKEYKKMSPIEIAKYRAEFDKVKNKVIKEWEENTGQKWPVYNENVISEKTGKIIRKQGDKYDAHHIIENTFGGEHEWWNMHPAKFPNEHQVLVYMEQVHQQIHYLKEAKNNEL